MDNIILQYILDLLTAWKDSFTTWANTIGDKIASIKTNTDNLPGIKADTADIKDNTAAVISPINSINANVSSISSDVGSIKTDTAAIKNNAGSIATSSGATAAFAEDIANNTLDCKNRLVTIGSDTTQIRTDSDSIAADVTEIKNTLGLYFYTTIVTEDAEGAIANFDTDLKDYLQNAVVTIPADAGGISGLSIINCGANLWDEVWELGTIVPSDGTDYPSTTKIRSKNYIPVKPGLKFRYIGITVSGATTDYIYCYDINKSYINYIPVSHSGTINAEFTTPNNCYFIRFICNNTVDDNIAINYPSTITTYSEYTVSSQNVSFTTPITDGAEVDLLSGIVKINTSPITYDSITPLAIRTFKGVNNIYSDIGDIDVTYRESLKKYLEKQEG